MAHSLTRGAVTEHLGDLPDTISLVSAPDVVALRDQHGGLECRSHDLSAAILLLAASHAPANLYWLTVP